MILRARAGWAVDIDTLSKAGSGRSRFGGRKMAMSVKFVTIIEGVNGLCSSAFESAYLTLLLGFPSEVNKIPG